jgi:hypothetical protein
MATARMTLYLVFASLLVLNGLGLHIISVANRPRLKAFAIAKAQPISRSRLHMSEGEAEAADTFIRDLGLLIEKALYTVEDVALHVRRGLITATKPKVEEDAAAKLLAFGEKADERRRIVVIGSGWSAHAFLKIAEVDDQVVCISPRPFFVFTPMLAATAVGTVEYRSIVEPIRGANPLADYLEG